MSYPDAYQFRTNALPVVLTVGWLLVAFLLGIVLPTLTFRLLGSISAICIATMLGGFSLQRGRLRSGLAVYALGIMLLAYTAILAAVMGALLNRLVG